MLWGLLLASSAAMASGWQAQNEAVWDTQNQRWIAVEQLAAQSMPGDIWVFGEEHATKDNAAQPSTIIHHDNQVRFLEALKALYRTQPTSVSVGMEFLTYTFQTYVNQYLAGVLPEADFLKDVQWSGGDPFEFYRRQIGSTGHTVALNTPPSIAETVAMQGPDSLSLDDRYFLPPVWEQGNPAYQERFDDAMKDHATKGELENYFWAQSLWDDTMAWRALLYREYTPDDVMVIIVGMFHVQYGGGLPYELGKLGHSRIRTLLQVETADWDPGTLSAAIAPDPKYGEQADYLWVHSGAVATP
jgi:uncharacterized iron-regulated protein